MLIRGAEAIMTGLPGAAMRAAGPDLRVGVDGRISEIGRLSVKGDERVIDAANCVIYPGWVNTHHHLLQALMKAVPAGINAPLNDWLAAVPFRLRAGYDAEMLETAGLLGLAELALSGCTTVVDFHNLYWRGMPYDGAEILFEAAEKIGLRLALCRGSQTGRRTIGATSIDALEPESLDEILKDIERTAARYHDPKPDARRRVVAGPTTPTFSMQPEEIRVFAQEARRLGLRLHSHLSEIDEFVTFCRDRYRMRPVEFCGEHGWLGEDVWFAHLVHVDAAEIRLLAQSRTGIAHCAGSNCRLGSGIAPVPEMAAGGMRISLGQDGGACNEPGDMLSEAHIAWYVHRARSGAAAVSVEDVIRWGSAGGADVLGLGDIGTLAPGKCADLAVYSLDDLRFAAMHDPAIAPVAAGVRPRLKLLLVGGRSVVEDDRLLGIDTEALKARVRSERRRLAAKF
jgi:cytosine/adenosine deaminase-related metal-dependent hydrolase